MKQLEFDSSKKYGLAFSGGSDSSCLLAEMLDAGIDVKPYFVKTAFQADFELEDARMVTKFLGTSFELIELDIFSQELVCANPHDRCYHCKHFIFSNILKRMERDGRTILVDGTNATDDPERRPGFRALAELSVVSPLRAAGWSKDDVRARSSEWGLFTATKPNFSCFATKVPQDERITPEALAKVRMDSKEAIQAWCQQRAC